MNAMKTLFCRIYQKCLFLAQSLLRFRVPETLEGSGALSSIPGKLKEEGKKHPLIVATPSMIRTGSISLLTSPLEEEGIPYELFSDVKPDSPFPVIEEAYELFRASSCDCLIAIGGGSAMDTAKAVGAKAANPKRPLSSFKGVLKVRRKIPFLIAIPTTAGSGSEATLASVVYDPENRDKFAINDPHLIPSLAVLDAELLLSLPPSVIASTGMDALTHALESFLGNARTKLTKKCSLQAMELIRDHLVPFCLDPKEKSHREAMLKASFLAGVSFTRGYVGYVHALAHALGGRYGVSHGYANAILLPFVLEGYGGKASKKLAEASSYLGLAPEKATREEKAKALIEWVKDLNRKMGLTNSLQETIREEDIASLAEHAAKEGNPLYPVPKEMDAAELGTILMKVKRNEID